MLLEQCAVGEKTRYKKKTRRAFTYVKNMTETKIHKNSVGTFLLLLLFSLMWHGEEIEDPQSSHLCPSLSISFPIIISVATFLLLLSGSPSFV
jgi:hypothetical protein